MAKSTKNSNQTRQSHTSTKDRSVVATVAGYFTIKWLVQTVAAWAFSMWLTRLWKKYVKKEKVDENNKEG